MSCVRYAPNAALLTLVVGLFPSTDLYADSASVALSSDHGDLSQALVSFHPADREYELRTDETYSMDQLDRQFRPQAIAIEKGASVSFLNNDDVRHHVYSFSAAKRFELPLYQGEPPEDIDFETAGEVVLGCNIHDWMVGWVHVMDTPYFSFADEDGLVLLDLPEGHYEMRIWHPAHMADDKRLIKDIVVESDGFETEITLDLEPEESNDLDRRRRDRF